MNYLTSLIAQMFPVQIVVTVNYLAKRYFVVRVVFVALFVVTVAFRFRIVLSHTSVLQWQWIFSVCLFCLFVRLFAFHFIERFDCVV